MHSYEQLDQLQMLLKINLFSNPYGGNKTITVQTEILNEALQYYKRRNQKLFLFKQ